MKKILFSVLVASVGVWSCTQNQQAIDPSSSSATTGSARLASDSTGFFCRDSLTKVAVADLPATITSYLTANYAGATVNYAAKDDSGVILVAITQNDTRKALLFNADGTFNQELALQRGRGGKGGSHGRGGRGNRDSIAHIAVADLPSAITSYITTNYAGATIRSAHKDDERGYFVMITVNDVRKTLLFNTDGTFKEEVVKPEKGNGNLTSVAVADLPAAITTYLSTNYAGSTTKKAAKTSDGQYIVWVQPTSGRPVELLFAADGAFKQVLSRR